MSIEQVTPEWIAKLENEMRTFSRLSARHCRELLDALTASRAEVQRLTEESHRSDAGRVEVLDRRELALLRQHWQLWEEEVSAEDPDVLHDKANAREEVDALLREHLTLSRLSPS